MAKLARLLEMQITVQFANNRVSFAIWKQKLESVFEQKEQ